MAGAILNSRDPEVDSASRLHQLHGFLGGSGYFQDGAVLVR